MVSFRADMSTSESVKATTLVTGVSKIRGEVLLWCSAMDEVSPNYSSKIADL